jgi:hypothetical protein
MIKADTACILEAIRAPYRLSDNATASPLGNGLINQTVLVRDAERSLVAQRINTFVFQDPGALVHNARAIVSHLEQKEQAPGVVRHLPGHNDCTISTAREISSNCSEVFRRRHPNYGNIFTMKAPVASVAWVNSRSRVARP